MENTIKLLNKELDYDFYTLLNGKVYFCGIEIIPDKNDLRYSLRKKAKPIIKSLLPFLSISDIVGELDEDDLLDEIGETAATRYFDLVTYPEYIEVSIFPNNSIEDYLKIKHLKEVWHKYTDDDFKRLL